MKAEIDPGLDEYPECKRVYSKVQKLLEELADAKAYLDEHKLGVEWLKAEHGADYDKTAGELEKAVSEGKRILAGPKAVEMYEKLLKTPLYDASCGQWNYSMYSEQRINNDERNSADQLSGVIALASIGRTEDAKKMYEMLTKTALYDTDKKQWNEQMDSEQYLQYPNRNAYGNLLGVIALASIGNVNKAKEAYNMLAETQLYDRQMNQWNQFINPKQKLKGADRYAGMQITGIAALCLIRRESEAEEAYERLKLSVLHDKARKQWNNSMTESQKVNDTDRYAEDHLLDVFALCLLGRKQEAEERYAFLASCLLYEPARMQWNTSMTAGQSLDNSMRVSGAQLLGVTALAMLEAR